MTAQSGLKILPCGDTAAVAEFGDVIDPVLNGRVLSLDAALAGSAGIVETVPTYRSLMIHYDPSVMGFADLEAKVRRITADMPDSPGEGRTWRIPVAYGGEFGVDLGPTAALHGISPDELVRRHCAPTYQVYMIGFLPGFAYLGGLDRTIATPRRTNPRLKTPPGTISIGGIQALVGSIEAPSGWHLLGRTPVRTYMPSREPTFLLSPGDHVVFAPIDLARFGELDRAAKAGEIVAELVAP